jgi:hypothetical protein
MLVAPMLGLITIGGIFFEGLLYMVPSGYEYIAYTVGYPLYLCLEYILSIARYFSGFDWAYTGASFGSYILVFWCIYIVFGIYMIYRKE